MKHLVKKYVNSAQLGDDVVDAINNAPIDEKKLAEISSSNAADHFALALTVDNKIYQTFQYQNGNKTYLIPEPYPIIIYFDTAVFHHKSLKAKREELLQKFTGYNDFMAVNGDFYWYFAVVSSFVIFLFLALEAFINKAIPKEFEYKRLIQDKKTELFNASQIQRNIEFLEKVKSVLPEIAGKNFVTEFTHKYELIRKLKLFRDEIVHTKSIEGDNAPNLYQDLFVTSLNFDFDNTLLAARDFINYHQPNLIEECDCGND